MNMESHNTSDARRCDRGSHGIKAAGGGPLLLTQALSTGGPPSKIHPLKEFPESFRRVAYRTFVVPKNYS